MFVQPRLTILIIADADQSRTYATIHSVQATRYRNHEILGVIPCAAGVQIPHLKRDFPWLPLLSAPYTSLTTLLSDASARAAVSRSEAVLFIQAGTTMAPNTIHRMAEQIPLMPQVGVFLPAVVRTDGSGIVYGGIQTGAWPYQLRSLSEMVAGRPEEVHPVGPVCLVRRSVVMSHPFHESADLLALLYWTERLLRHQVKSLVLPDITVQYDGVLACDYAEMLVVPAAWFRDMDRYITRHGTWYDRGVFRLRFSWRKEGTLPARLMHLIGLRQHIAMEPHRM